MDCFFPGNSLNLNATNDKKEDLTIRQNDFFIFSVFSLIILIIISIACSSEENAAKKHSQNYEDLVKLFQEFREFQKPKLMDGIPDYTATAMEEQRRGLQHFHDRLAAIDISAWPVSHP